MLWSIYFKSESCDEYDFTIKSAVEPTEDAVLQWLFEVVQVDGGSEDWDMPYNEIPYCSLKIKKVKSAEDVDADFDKED